MGSNTSFSFLRNDYRIPSAEKMLQMFADMLFVVMLETAEATIMKQDKNNNYFEDVI